MRTSFIEPKTDRSLATHRQALSAMPQPRPPLHPPSDRRGLRGDGPSDRDAWERGDSEPRDLPYESDGAPDYLRLRKDVATEKKLLDGEVEDDFEKEKKKKTDRGTEDENYSPLKIGVLSAVVLAIAALCVYKVWPDRETETQPVDETWFREHLLSDVRQVRNKFPSQSDVVWLDLFSGIRKVAIDEPTEPTVFLLVHAGGGAAACLAREVAQVAHRLLNASRPDLLVVDGARLAVGPDHGTTVDSYRDLVREHRVMVVDNLQSVPADIARSLHAICDTFTPLVRKAVYVLTLDVGAEGGGGGSVVGVAERRLNALWGRLEADTLAALVARVTGGSVFRVEPEERVPDVC